MEAVQEAIVNAVCHRDYRSNGSVQVMLFRNRLEIWNPGVLPFGLTIAKLYEDHKSIPANPLLAEPMYYKGYIEKAGTGTGDIVEKCRSYGLPMPQYQQDEDFRVVLYRPEIEESVPDQLQGTQSEVRDPVKGPSQGPSQGLSQGLSQKSVEKILHFCIEPQKLAFLCKQMNFANRTKFRDKYISPLLREEYLEMTIPGKPTSSQQKYRTTTKGLQLLETH